MALVSTDTKIAEYLTELHQLIKQTQEERSRSEHNLLNIQKTHERMQTENKTSPYYRTKLRGLYTTAKADAEAECSILRHALDKIAEIKSLLEERRIAAKMAGVYSDSDPPRKTMRRGVLMTLLQQSAMTLPLWIGKPGESPPPLCGAIPASSDYVAKPGDKVAARVKAVDGDEQWILAEVVSYSHSTNKYEVDDIDEEGKERHTLSRRRIIPLPQWKANPETDPEALFSKDHLVLALYPQTTCFYRALIHTPPHRVSGSNSGAEASATPEFKQPAKRRRILDPSAVVTVPIYSNKVNSCLKLNPSIPIHTSVSDGAGELNIWPGSQSPPSKKDKPVCIDLSDSEEESEAIAQLGSFRSPSPPSPPQSPVVKASTRASCKIREINRKLNALDSLFLPGDSGETSSDRGKLSDSEDDDIIVVSDRLSAPAQCEKPREISLKIRYRADVHKVPIRSTSPLRTAVSQMSVKLSVPPQRILLLRNDTELPVESTPSVLGLGIADIIDCVVLHDEVDTEKSGDVITLRLQGKDKGSSQDFSIHKEAPLGSILSQYLSQMAASSQRKVHFLFDGSKVIPSQTPAQLDMEDGDVIEVWT
uniref:SAGA complex associated factor 29 n=1 Tax=Paramormyrops kingsleyae TaxID=1676925 RepID=A0A3B3QXX5_9TELE